MKLNNKHLIESALKLLFALAFVLLLFYQLRGHLQSIYAVKASFIIQNQYLIAWVLLLMLVCLMLEAYKWKITLSSQYNISFFNALQSTLGGNSLSAFTPNRLGEFAGRIMFLPARHRRRGAVLTLMGSYSQLLCTIIGGIWALTLYIVYQLHTPPLLNVACIILSIICTAILLTSYFNVALIVPVISQIKFLSPFQQHVSVLNVLHIKTLTQIMMLSVLKYIVFNIQYILLLQMGGSLFHLNQLLYQLPLIFFIQTIIPSFTIAEVGIRGSISLFILHATGAMVTPAFLSATLLWVINLIIPSIVGGIIVLRHKFITS